VYIEFMTHSYGQDVVEYVTQSYMQRVRDSFIGAGICRDHDDFMYVEFMTHS